MMASLYPGHELPQFWALLPVGWHLSAVEGRLWVLSVIWAFCQLALTSTAEDCFGNVCVWDSTGHPRREFMTDLSFGVWVCIPFIWLVSLFPYVKWEIQFQLIKKNFICGIMISEIMTKNHFSCGIMTKKKSCRIMIFLNQCMATIFFRFQIGYDDTLEIQKKQDLFAYAVRES